MCLLTVFGDNSVTDYTRTLNCPVVLKGALAGIDTRDPKIFIMRNMEEKGIIIIH